MKVWNKIGIAALVGAVSLTALYSALIISIPNFVDIDKYKASVFEAIEKETQFKVSCEKAEFIKGFSPYLKIHLYHTGVMYPDNNVFLQLKEADLRVKTLPLIFKKVEIKDAHFERPIINITLYKDFSTSLEKYFTDKTLINTNGFLLNQIIPVVEAKNYKIKFQDESINKTFYLEGDELQLSDLKLNESVHVAIKGAVFENKKEYIKYDLDVLTSLNSERQRFTFSPFKSINDSDVKGSILGHLKTDKQNNIHGDLKIENLSLNLGNVISSNNNADLVFKGNDVEINAVIHPAHNDIAKVQGKFGFGKKRYIDLNTNAKNINLENLFKIVSATAKILNIENPLNDVSAKGILNADFNIKSDFKKLESSGRAEIVNANLTHKLLQYPISGINANVNFANNEIVIEKALANINKTPVKLEGTVKNDLTADLKAYSDNLDLKTVAAAFLLGKELPFEIKKGNMHFETEIKGNLGGEYKTLSNIYIKDLNFVEKVSKIPVNAKKCIFNLRADTKKYNGDIAIENADFQYNNKIIKAPKFTVLFDDKNINIPKNTVVLINSPINIEGSVINYNSNPAAKINYAGSLIANDLAALISQYVKQPYKALGKINTKGSIDFAQEKYKIKTQFNADKDNYISYLVIQELLNKPSVTNIDIEGEKNLVTIKDISLSQNNAAQIKITGQIENPKEPVLKNINVNIPNAISVASNFLGGEEISLKADLTLNKNLKTPDIKGSVKIIKYNLKKYLTAVKNADVSFSSDNIRIVAPDVTVNNSLFNITADIVPNLKNIIISNLQFNSMNLDMNSLFDLIHNEQNIFAKSLITVKNGSATINNLKMLDLKAHDISSDFKIEKNILKIYNINAAAYQGSVIGKANYELSNGIMDIDMTGKNLNIKNSLYDLCKLEDNLSGQADVKTQISFMTGPYNTVIKTLSGTMEFNARNGSMGTLGKFEYYLNAKNILYHGLLNTTLNRLIQTISHDDTTHYNLADGKIIFQNGYMITDDTHTQGEKMSLTIKGRHNLLTNQSNFDIYGRITDEISSKLGNFGDISISELVNGQESKKNNVVLVVPSSVINDIRPLYNRSAFKTNTFKVNVMGDMNALNAINSFAWIVPDLQSAQEAIEDETETLPNFSDL